MKAFMISYCASVATVRGAFIIAEDKENIPKYLAEKHGVDIDDIQDLTSREVSLERVPINNLSAGNFLRLLGK